jgi:peptide/nickel transport system permease protein
MLVHRLARACLTLSVTIVLGGLAAATLARMAPGFDVDVRELDPRLSAESVNALRHSRAAQSNILAYYKSYLVRVAHGDLGVSQSLNRPVAELFAERLPVTARTVAAGMWMGWAPGLLLTLLATGWRRRALDLSANLLSAALLCLPSAVVALALLFFSPAGFRPSTAVGIAVALVVFPRVFRYARGILAQVARAPHVLMAQAKGVGPLRILLTHIVRPALPSILALAGVSVSVAFGAAIPIEVISDSPGIGQLAWQAALQRDLPLLVNVGLLVTIITVGANSLAGLAQGWLTEEAAA